MTKEQRIFERCKKLLAMANDASSENEAATAMRQLQILIAKHSISMDELEQVKAEVGKSDGWSYSANGAWSRIIANAIAKLYFCKMSYSRDSYKQSEYYTYYGEEVNRMVAEQMAEAAIKQVNKEANKQAKEYGGGKIDYRFRVSFRNGAAMRVHERVELLVKLARRGELQDEDGNNLPVLADVYDRKLQSVQDFMDELGGFGKGTTRTKTTSRAGHQAGQAEGSRVKLQSGQIGNNKKLLK